MFFKSFLEFIFVIVCCMPVGVLAFYLFVPLLNKIRRDAKDEKKAMIEQERIERGYRVFDDRDGQSGKRNFYNNRRP